jgi:tRNA-2-methylthio-N6-dimethylallyladenosine synthase
MQKYISNSGMTYHLVTFGCQMNKSDSERVRTVIEGMGYTWTDHEEEAGLIGVLACSVRQKAIDKVYSRIYKWNSWKNRKNLLTFLTGCVLPADREKFLKLFDLIFTIEELPELENMIRQYGVVTPAGLIHKQQKITQKYEPVDKGKTHELQAANLIEVSEENKKTGPDDPRPFKKHQQSDLQIGKFWKITPAYVSGFEAFVPIQNGCNKFCTFCAVPYTRGREVSRPSGEILSEIQYLIDHDYKSITLLGQNVNSYGQDKKGAEITFQELLEKIGKLCDTSGKEVWVYFTSPHPRDMNEEVIRVISRYKSLAKQIHLPIQSGDDNVLSRMNRKHTVDRYRKIIASVREYLPEATIFTDIIVGFTGETDEQFENTRKIMEEFRYNMAYIAIYSPRPGAASSKWTDDIPHDIKKKRLHILSGELKKHSSEQNLQMIGKTYRVLVTGQDRKEGYLSGHTEGRIIVRFPSNDLSLPGTFVNIKITGASDFSIEGVLIRIKEPELIDK